MLVLGGGSEIAIATTRLPSCPDRGARAVTLLGRPTPRRDAGGRRLAPPPRCRVAETAAFDAADVDGRRRRPSTRRSAPIGDFDVVLPAFGVLGDQAPRDQDRPRRRRSRLSPAVNFAGHRAAPPGRAARLRAQGHGALVVFSSVAGQRPRRANFVYGAAKSGVDAFSQGLGDSLVGTGVGVTIVRPGFVVGRMTEGMEPGAVLHHPGGRGRGRGQGHRVRAPTSSTPRRCCGGSSP